MVYFSYKCTNDGSLLHIFFEYYYRLVDSLNEFSKEDTKYLEERRFPKEILTGQVIAVWKEVVEQASATPQE